MQAAGRESCGVRVGGTQKERCFFLLVFGIVSLAASLMDRWISRCPENVIFKFMDVVLMAFLSSSVVPA